MGDTGKVGTNPLEQFASGTRRATRGPRNLLLGQLAEALSTGGVGARLPFVQRAVEASQQANAQGLSRTKEDLARSGVSGLFARNALAGQRQAGNLASSQIESNLLQQFISQTIPFLTATQNTAFGALQGVLQGKQFNAAQTANALDSIGRNASIA